MGRAHGGAELADVRNVATRCQGGNKREGANCKPCVADIKVAENGKPRKISVASFAREEDAARAWDRVNIAKLGHAKAKTNFPVAEYRAEWAELEARGVDGAVACERQRARKR